MTEIMHEIPATRVRTLYRVSRAVTGGATPLPHVSHIFLSRLD